MIVNSDKLQLTLSDTKSPSLSSFTFSTPTIDLSLDDAAIRFKADAIDDLSGVKAVYGSWRSPSDDQDLYVGAYDANSIISGTKANGTWRSETKELNRYSEVGRWKLDYFYVEDEAGNGKEYDKFDFDDLGFPSSFEVVGGTEDTTLPSLTSFNFSPQVVDLSLNDAAIRFNASAIDDLSGVKQIYGFWNSPSREHALSLSAHDDYFISGTKVNGTWRSYTEELNRYSEVGTWRLDHFIVEDEAGNRKEYDKFDFDELGFPI